MRPAILLAICVVALTGDRSSAQDASPSPEGQPPPVAASRIALGPEGFLEFHLLMQAWSINSFDPRNPYVSGNADQSTFLVRRTEMKLAGEVLPQVSFEFMIDPSRVLEFGSKNVNVVYPATSPSQPAGAVAVQQPIGPVGVMRDAFLTFKYLPYAEVSIGQGHTPISYEGLAASANLMFVERAEVSRIFGDQRDLGFWVHYQSPRFSYVAGVFNGAGGGNIVDTSGHQDVAGRIEVSPVAGLQLGGSALRTMAGAGRGVHTTAGADVVFRRNRFTAQSEFYWNSSFSFDDAATETRRRGGCVSARYLVGRWFRDWQVAARADRFNPVEAVPDADYVRLTGGLNLLLDGTRAKLQFNYTHTAGAVTSPAPGVTNDPRNNLVLLNAQIAF
jgi:phosphate-selective porin O/P